MRLRTNRLRRLAAAISFIVSASGHAATITVTSSDDSPSSTGCNLRAALDSVSINTIDATCSSDIVGTFGDNDTIEFAPELANATITLARGAIEILAEVRIQGSGQTIDAQGQSRILTIDSESTVSASDLTLKNGTAYSGACVYVAGSVASPASFTLINSTVTGCHASSGTSGALYVDENSTLALRGSIVTANEGTGIVTNFGHLTLDHSTVSANTAPFAGGLYLTAATATLMSSTISGNKAANCGDGFCAGGMFASGSYITATDSLVSGNQGLGHVIGATGGAYLFNCTTTFTNSTIYGNSATGNDYVAGAFRELHFVNFPDSYLKLVNTTVVANTAASYDSGAHAAGGLLISRSGDPYFSGLLALSNTIASNNSPADTDIFAGDTATVSATYSLLGTSLDANPFDGAANHNVFNDAPGLGPLQSNGGPTLTMAPGLTSPARHAGSVALATYSGQPLHYDQRGPGFLRTFAGAIDIGAFQDQRDRFFADGMEPAP